METIFTQEILFEIKQKFLRDIPHPKLIIKQLNRLTPEHKIQFSSLKVTECPTDLLTSLKNYTANLLLIKLSISNSQTQLSLSEALHQLLLLQNSLIHQLSGYIDSPVEVDTSTIKMSAAFEIHELTKFIEHKAINESEIKGYICKELKQLSVEEFSILTTTVLRANKIVNS